jgi:hypothetical protein
MKKTKRFFGFLVLLAALMLPSCDMEYVLPGGNGNSPGIGEFGSPDPVIGPDGELHTYLTITGLPLNTQALDVSDVFVWNQTGKVAQCENYELLVIEDAGPTATLRIPLVYSQFDRIFGETGSYFVTFDLNIDALTRIVVSENNKVLASFTGGNGFLDSGDLLPVPYLTIQGLPATTTKGNFSDVFVYNTSGVIAKCANYGDIILTKTDSSVSALIPLYDTAAKDYFRDSGFFFVTYTINNDVFTQYIKTPEDSFAVHFTDGSGTVNLASIRGYFSGGLVNPADTSPPVIAEGTSFEINGTDAVIESNTAVRPITVQQTSVVYIYAYHWAGTTEFEYSDTPPVFDPVKNGYYNGNKRALYRLVFVKDTVDGYFAKTFIDDPWPHLAYYTFANPNFGRLSSEPVYTLSGDGNPEPQIIGLPPGVYSLVLSGAGGGGGSTAYSNTIYGGPGGSGGYVSEIFIVTSYTPLTVFSGEGGGGSQDNYQTSSGGGGGGGSGTFAFSADGYFLCAGGGGGGGGGKISHAKNGAGGAGGSIGSGGSGSGSRKPGGEGGGYRGGPPGTFTTDEQEITGNDAAYSLFDPCSWGYNGISVGNGGRAAYMDHEWFLWQNTNNANGQGANAPFPDESSGLPGGPGGNNRNSLRGGGALGGSGGAYTGGTVDFRQGSGKKGSTGSLIIYRVF